MTPKEKTLRAELGRGLICKTEIPKHEQVWEGTLIMVDTYLSQVEINDKGELYCLDIEDVKPYLRDLSDLDKEIQQDGKKFNVIEKYYNNATLQITRFYSEQSKELTLSATYSLMGEVFTDFIINRNSFKDVDFGLVEFLLDHHFNVFNLPETDYIKATPENNPY